MPADAPESVWRGQGADSAQIGAPLHDRETGVSLTMALIPTPFPHSLGHKRKSVSSCEQVHLTRFAGALQIKRQTRRHLPLMV